MQKTQTKNNKSNLRTLREKLSPRNLGAQFGRAFLRPTTRRRHRHPLQFLRGVTWISHKFINPTNPKITCMHRNNNPHWKPRRIKVSIFSPWHWGDTKASPSTGAEGDLSGDIASQPSTAFNDAVSGRSEGLSSGSADSLAVPDSLTGATEGTVVDEESSDTYVIRERENRSTTYRIEIRIGYPDEEKGNWDGKDCTLDRLVLLGGEGEERERLEEEELLRLVSTMVVGSGAGPFRGGWEKRSLWIRMMEADHVYVVKVCELLLLCNCYCWDNQSIQNNTRYNI